jgi:hypothetical protein
MIERSEIQSESEAVSIARLRAGLDHAALRCILSQSSGSPSGSGSAEAVVAGLRRVGFRA